MELRMQIARKLKQWRTHKDFTQEYIAEKLGIQSSSGYGKIELGKIGLSAEAAIILAELYEITLDELLLSSPKVVPLQEPQANYQKVPDTVVLVMSDMHKPSKKAKWIMSQLDKAFNDQESWEDFLDENDDEASE